MGMVSLSSSPVHANREVLRSSHRLLSGGKAGCFTFYFFTFSSSILVFFFQAAAACEKHMHVYSVEQPGTRMNLVRGRWREMSSTRPDRSCIPISYHGALFFGGCGGHICLSVQRFLTCRQQLFFLLSFGSSGSVVSWVNKVSFDQGLVPTLAFFWKS